jgi:Sulfotransferase domain
MIKAMPKHKSFLEISARFFVEALKAKLPGSQKHHFLLACMPKSGSTFLSEVIGNLPDFRKVSLVNDYDRREQELSLERLVFCNRYNYVSQLHVRNHTYTEYLANRFNLKQIVLIRDIFDIVVSIRDHLNREGPVFPMGYMDDTVKDRTDNEIHHLIADMLIPWYINFYATWYHSNNRLIVNYQDLNSSPEKVLREILDYSHLSFTDDQISTALLNSGKKSTRKNKAIVGRGEVLSDEVKAKIVGLTRHYPEIDFSPIGLSV